MRLLIQLLVLSPIGRFILQIRYRNQEKVNAVLKSEYDGDYANVATNYIFALFLIVFAGLILVLLVVKLTSLILCF